MLQKLLLAMIMLLNMNTIIPCLSAVLPFPREDSWNPKAKELKLTSSSKLFSSAVLIPRNTLKTRNPKTKKKKTCLIFGKVLVNKMKF